MAERPGRRRQEIAALRTGLDLGMTVIDTAEMYADGGAEELVAAGDRRPARRGVPGDEGVHWREGTPLEETLEGLPAFHAPARSGTGASATSTPALWRSS
jgi:aldo/keto reductase family protein